MVFNYTYAQRKNKSSVIKPVAELEAGIFHYTFTVHTGAQDMAMAMQREIKLVDDKWIVTDAVQSPLGEVSEENILDRKTLRCLHRKTKQGPVTIDLLYTDKKVTGSVDLGSGKTPINVDLEKPIYIDGAGTDLVVGRLPLEQNVSIPLETFDPQTSQINKYDVTFVSTENIKVPAGEFSVMKITMDQVNGAEKRTFWISQKDKRMIRSEAILPQMGNARVVAELQ